MPKTRAAWPDAPLSGRLLALLAGTVPAVMRLIAARGTILLWQRDIARRLWARRSRRGRSGRPAAHRTVRSVMLRLARENESRGYRRIHGGLAALRITVAGLVAQIGASTILSGGGKGQGGDTMSA